MNVRALPSVSDPDELIRIGEAFAVLQKTEGYAILIEFLKRGADEAAQAYFAGEESADGKANVRALYALATALPAQVEALVQAAARALESKQAEESEFSSMRLGGGNTAVG